MSENYHAMSNEELNEQLSLRGLNSAVETDEDRPVAINILSQLADL